MELSVQEQLLQQVSLLSLKKSLIHIGPNLNISCICDCVTCSFQRYNKEKAMCQKVTTWRSLPIQFSMQVQKLQVWTKTFQNVLVFCTSLEFTEGKMGTNGAAGEPLAQGEMEGDVRRILIAWAAIASKGDF